MSPSRDSDKMESLHSHLPSGWRLMSETSLHLRKKQNMLCNLTREWLLVSMVTQLYKLTQAGRWPGPPCWFHKPDPSPDPAASEQSWYWHGAAGLEPSGRPRWRPSETEQQSQHRLTTHAHTHARTQVERYNSLVLFKLFLSWASLLHNQQQNDTLHWLTVWLIFD